MKPAPPVTKILISLSSIAPDLSFASPCWWALFDARLRPGNLFYSCLSDLLIAIKHQDLSRSARPPDQYLRAQATQSVSSCVVECAVIALASLFDVGQSVRSTRQANLRSGSSRHGRVRDHSWRARSRPTGGSIALLGDAARKSRGSPLWCG